jgi:hypothetical protein
VCNRIATRGFESLHLDVPVQTRVFGWRRETVDVVVDGGVLEIQAAETLEDLRIFMKMAERRRCADMLGKCIHERFERIMEGLDRLVDPDLGAFRQFGTRIGKLEPSELEPPDDSAQNFRRSAHLPASRMDSSHRSRWFSSSTPSPTGLLEVLPLFDSPRDRHLARRPRWSMSERNVRAIRTSTGSRNCASTRTSRDRAARRATCGSARRANSNSSSPAFGWRGAAFGGLANTTPARRQPLVVPSGPKLSRRDEEMAVESVARHRCDEKLQNLDHSYYGAGGRLIGGIVLKLVRIKHD